MTSLGELLEDGGYSTRRKSWIEGPNRFPPLPARAPRHVVERGDRWRTGNPAAPAPEIDEAIEKVAVEPKEASWPDWLKAGGAVAAAIIGAAAPRGGPKPQKPAQAPPRPARDPLSQGRYFDSIENAKMMPEQMTGAQALKLFQEGGKGFDRTKKAEIEAFGLSQFLAGKDKVTREEVLGFLRDKRPELELTRHVRGDVHHQDPLRQGSDYMGPLRWPAFTYGHDPRNREVVYALPQAKEQKAQAEAIAHRRKQLIMMRGLLDTQRNKAETDYLARELNTPFDIERAAQNESAIKKQLDEFHGKRRAIEAELQDLTKQEQALQKGKYTSGHWPGVNDPAFHVRTGIVDLPVAMDKALDIGQRIKAAMGEHGAKLENLGSGAAEVAVQRGAITPDEAAFYSYYRDWQNTYTHGEERHPNPFKGLVNYEAQSDWHNRLKDAGEQAPPETIRRLEMRFENTANARKQLLAEATEYFRAGLGDKHFDVPSFAIAKKWLEAIAGKKPGDDVDGLVARNIERDAREKGHQLRSRLPADRIMQSETLFKRMVDAQEAHDLADAELRTATRGVQPHPMIKDNAWLPMAMRELQIQAAHHPDRPGNIVMPPGDVPSEWFGHGKPIQAMRWNPDKGEFNYLPAEHAKFAQFSSDRQVKPNRVGSAHYDYWRRPTELEESFPHRPGNQDILGQFLTPGLAKKLLAAPRDKEGFHVLRDVGFEMDPKARGHEHYYGTADKPGVYNDVLAKDLGRAPSTTEVIAPLGMRERGNMAGLGYRGLSGTHERYPSGDTEPVVDTRNPHRAHALSAADIERIKRGLPYFALAPLAVPTLAGILTEQEDPRDEP